MIKRIGKIVLPVIGITGIIFWFVWFKWYRQKDTSTTGTKSQKDSAPPAPVKVRGLRASVDPATASVKLQWFPPNDVPKETSYLVRFKPTLGPWGHTYTQYRTSATHLNIGRNLIEPLEYYTFEVKVNATNSEWSAVNQFIEWHCRLPGCCRNRQTRHSYSYTHRHDVIYDWCSKSHYVEFAANYCLFPECTEHQSHCGSHRDFCSSLHHQRATETGFAALVEVASTTEEYESVQLVFRKGWAKAKGDCPRIKTILRVINPAAAKKFENYNSTLPPGYQTVEKYFHGTKLQCPITSSLEFCDEHSCGVCGIAKRGFDLRRVRRHRWQRFGHAIYLAPNSSKSSGYPLGEYFVGSFQTMFLCHVAPGRKYVVRYNRTDLSGPPLGYHSVYGETKFLWYFGHLNYKEIALYNSAAILPMYVICYS